MDNHFCNHQKFGYHKFAMHCLKEYMKEKWKALSACKDIKFATKNIPRFATDLPSRTSVNLENSVYMSTWFEIKKDVKIWKQKWTFSTNTLKSLSGLKQEGNMIMKSINVWQSIKYSNILFLSTMRRTPYHIVDNCECPHELQQEVFYNSCLSQG